MKRTISFLLAVLMLLTLSACGKEQPTYDDAGYYVIFSSSEGDNTMTAQDFADMDWTVFLELNEDGAGVLDMDDGDVTELTWSDGSITMDGKTIDYALAGGLLTLDLTDSDGLVLVFRKGERPTAESASAGGLGKFSKTSGAPETAPAASPVGAYKLREIISDDPDASATAEDVAMLESLGLTCMLYMRDDGTGTMDMYGEVDEFTWKDDTITVDGENVSFTFENDTLTISENGEGLVFEKVSDDPAGAPAATEPEPEPEKPDTPASAVGADFAPVGGQIGDSYVEIVGAEHFTSSEGGEAIRVYYDFTNESDESTSAWMALSTAAKQSGFSLVSTYASYEDDVPEYGNHSLSVEPGVTIRCIEEFEYQTDKGEVEFTISDYSDALSAVFDPDALPGRPAEDWEIELIDDPQFYLDYPGETSTDSFDLAITTAELTDGYFDETVLRVFLDFTNGSDKKTSCWMATNITAYQDGIELESSYPDEEAETDDLFYEDVDPGASLTCSRCWELRTDSPVEVVVYDWNGVLCAGTMYIAD